MQYCFSVSYDPALVLPSRLAESLRGAASSHRHGNVRDEVRLLRSVSKRS